MSNFASLQGQKVVVTGASSGIGRAIALEFARAGADLFLTCRASIDGLRATEMEAKQGGGSVGTFAGDLTSPEVRLALVERSLSDMERIDIWVNNCGADILTGAAANFSYDKKLRMLLDVDLEATIHLSRLVGNHMKRAGRGTILNIGWDQADRGMEGDSGELFAVAKSAIMAFTRSHSLNMAPEVRVNCIAPGWIKTAWGETASDQWQQRVLLETPLRRWGLPEDIAQMARFLCSDAASFITGQVVNVNGGAVR